MGALSPDERRAVERACGGTLLAVTVARLYKAFNSSWVQKGMGAAAVVANDAEGTHFLKLLDLNSHAVTFCQQLYENFEYVKAEEFFHFFEADDCVAGLSFADTSDAAQFFLSVAQCRSRLSSSPAAVPARRPLPARRPVPPPHTVPARQQNRRPLTSPPAAVAQPAPAATVSEHAADGKWAGKKWGLGRKMRGLFRKDDNAEDQLLPISEPQGFRHISSIGWKADTGFEIRDIPPEWKKLFQAAGIKKRELKDKDTAAFVMNIIEGQLDGGAGVATEAAGSPAPPPPLPPPPPPTPPAAPSPPPAASAAAACMDAHSAAPARAEAAPVERPVRNSARSDLLSQIREGKTLAHVEEGASTPAPPMGLAETLAAAMEKRRPAVSPDNEDDDEGDDEDWSDGDWSS